MPTKKAPLAPLALRKNPHLYEINTWAWLEQLSARLGRPVSLEGVPDSEWIALARLGFNAIWLMGLWQRSPESQRIMAGDPGNFAGYSEALPGWRPSDILGSPYAVAQYAPDLRIGTWESLDRVREKLRGLGMALFLDFVGNHTALDHPWTRQHPDFYILGSQQDFERNPSSFYKVDTKEGGHYLALAKDPYYPPWKDVAQLNHFNPAMRAAQIADLQTIAQHCDGIRCDMAMLHLHDIFGNNWAQYLGAWKAPQKEFWTEVHDALPGLILLAEAYWGTEPRLLDLGFLRHASIPRLGDCLRELSRLRASPRRRVLRPRWGRTVSGVKKTRRVQAVGKDERPYHPNENDQKRQRARYPITFRHFHLRSI